MSTPDPAETRDRLRALFELLGIPVRVEVGTVGLQASVVITPLRAGDADRLAQALDASDSFQREDVRRLPDGWSPLA